MDKTDILKKPLITERALAQAALGWFTFEVARDANKNQIREAVEETFGVEVVKVRTVSLQGKKRRAGWRFPTETSKKKKAIVKLKEGQKIEAFEIPSQEGSQAKAKKKKEEEGKGSKK